MKTSFARAFAATALLLVTGCKDKAAAPSTSDSMAKMSEFRDRMCACKDAACTKQLSEEMTDWSKKQSTGKPSALTPAEQKQATEIGTQIGECMMKATGLGGATAEPQPANGSAGSAAEAGSAGSAGSATDVGSAGSAADVGSAGSAAVPAGTNAQGLPKECDDYKAAVEKLRTCEALAKQARETLIKGYEDASARWATGGAEMKASLAQACKGGHEAIVSVGKAQCGW